jgi:methionine-rich copper-binding protein CopC
MIRAPLFAVVAVPLLMSTGTAFAHADLETSNPSAGSTVKTAPTEISITFSEEVEPRFSGIEVQDAQGQRVDEGEAHSASDDAKVLTVGLKPLTPGTYKVIWHNTSVDSHKEKGSFEFTVKP